MWSDALHSGVWHRDSFEALRLQPTQRKRKPSAMLALLTLPLPREAPAWHLSAADLSRNGGGRLLGQEGGAWWLA